MSVIKQSLIAILPLCLGVALATAPGTAGAQTAAAAYTSGIRYDAAARVTGTLAADPDGSGPLAYIAVRNTYDDAGRLSKIEKGQLSAWQSDTVAPQDWTGFAIQSTTLITYDAMARKLSESILAGGAMYSFKQYGYDSLGRLQCTATRMNPGQWGSQVDACVPQTSGANGPDRITKNIYDAAGQLVQVRNAVGTSLEQAYATYSYTDNGKQQDVVDANGNRAHMVYDSADRLQQWQFPGTGNVAGFNPSTFASALATAGAANTADYEQYGYDANGNRTQLRKRDGRAISYSYDALNRIMSKTNPANSGARDVYYGYDLQGHQTYARFESGSGEGISNVYDGFGELTSTTINLGGVSRTLSFQYDADGNRTHVTHPDGVDFIYDYDGLDRVSKVSQGGTALAAWTYNAGGLPAARQDGTAGGSVSYGYDGIDRLEALTISLAGASSLGVGNGCTSAINGNPVSFSYNPAGQIICRSRSNDAYAWTGSVNVNRSYSPNGLNQYVSAGPAQFQYDANGNLTSSATAVGTADGTTTYTYDIENRLIAASNGTTLTYDPLGRLWQVAGSSGTTRFLYDGDQLTVEYDGNGTLLRRYVHGTGDDDPFLWYEGSGVGLDNARFLKADHQGSVVSVANANAQAIAINNYDDYGIPGSANKGRFQYTGQAWIPELGMYHYKARLYSPTLGRFLQTDPVGYKDQINLYAYVANDPLNGRDPSGTQTAILPAAELGCAATGPACPVGAVLGGAIATGATLCVGSDTCRGIVADGVRSLRDRLFGGPKRPDGPLEARSKTDPEGDPAADGAPHSVPDGKGGYTSYGPRDPVTGKPESTKQYRPAPGKPHGPIERPNVKDRPASERPDGAKVPGTPVVRPPRPDEIPK